jgi:hypothetical protein
MVTRFSWSQVIYSCVWARFLHDVTGLYLWWQSDVLSIKPSEGSTLLIRIERIMIWPHVSFCLVCLWSSAWINLGLSCNGYVDIALIYVQFGDFISVCVLQCQFIPLHTTNAMEVVEAERHLFLVSALEVSSQLQISLVCLGKTAPFLVE